LEPSLEFTALGSKPTKTYLGRCCLFCYDPRMEPGFKPKWTKGDTLLCVQMGIGFPLFSAFIGFLTGKGFLWGLIGGAALWAIITIGALVKFAYGRHRP
jgi:hypothetical protein